MNKLPPGPPSKLFGLNQVALFQQDHIMQTFEKCAAVYGDVVRVALAGFPQTMVFHPDYVRQILIDESEKITRSKMQQRLLGTFQGNSLVNSEGEFWRRQRKLMLPAFHAKRIQGYVQTMTDHTASALQRWQVGSTYNVADEMLDLTLGVAAETMFGTDVTGMTDRIKWAIRTMDDYTMRKAPAMLPLPIWIPLPYHRRAQQAIQELRALVMDFITSRRASGEDRGDLLSMLLLSVDENGEHGGGQMTNLQARDEAVSTLIVGHTTTFSALSWAFFEIARHPEVEAKIRAELDVVLAGRPPTMQDIRQLKYLDMVIKETLRLHPPSWAMPRDVVQDIEVGGYLIPKGTGVLFCQHVMHRDARWFPKPNRFLPERFAEGWESKVPRCAYMPFGMGGHNCLGQIFAATEMTVILAMTMQRYQMMLVPDQEIVPAALLSQRPRNGVQMRVVLRRQPALATV